ncbi:hypothetical protein RIF29_14798 [Crotalaria pallida]|uniref:Uncharacterized protein n=1 Tax=Crotalaria pallida TaxID=3830 RepID=A0AAN9FHS0_CROPI
MWCAYELISQTQVPFNVKLITLFQSKQFAYLSIALRGSQMKISRHFNAWCLLFYEVFIVQQSSFKYVEPFLS